ncbi:E3 ubiquitin-protein ligase TRIM39-like isoform X2 [Anas acuta]|uniref:E3 ubiquitin-protein ligase TRIM39-like isoform X2 n=1 Tax=Anas acuta TaxID=28680 RepID=UPI0035C8EB19
MSHIFSSCILLVTDSQEVSADRNSSFSWHISHFQEDYKQLNLIDIIFLEVPQNVCSEMNLRAVLFLALPKCFLISKWFTGEVPITISIDPSVVCVGEQVTLSCQLTHSVPSDTGLLWYKKEKERNTPLCSSSSLGGVVEQCQDEEWCRIKGRWERRSLLLIIQQVQVTDEGEYVCAVSGSAGSQEAVIHLDVTALGNKPTLERDQQEEGMCRYTCKSKGWNPKPEVLWTNYGESNKNVEARTYVTWNERDVFSLQSIMTVPCDDVDVKCVVALVKEKISRTGRTVEINTAKALESFHQEEERILSEKLAVLQSQLEVSQDAATTLEELAKTQTSLQTISEKLHTLQESLQNLEASREQDLQILREEMEDRISKDLEAAKKSWTKESLLEMENKLGRTMDINTKTTLHSMQEKAERILTEKLAVMQSQLEVSQNAAPPLEEQAKTLTSLQAVPEKYQSMLIPSENVEASRKQDLEILRAEMGVRISKDLEAAKRSWTKEILLEMETKLGRTVEINTTRALESLRQEEERILSEKLAVLQSQLEVSQNAATPLEEQAKTQTSLQAVSEKLHTLQKSLQTLETSREEELQILREEMEGRISKDLEAAKKSWIKDCLLEMETKLVLLLVQQYKVDVTLDADTAHPRLQVSEDGKSVTDTGVIRRVPVKEERFDSHAFVLAKEGYTSGRLYWEVDVGKRRNWILGVAQETVTRKGTVVLSPQNGFWVIELADEQEYVVHTNPWTHLTVSGRPQKIGMFLDISAKKLSFYSVHQKKALYTFKFGCDLSQEVRLFPFFSTGSTAIKADSEPLQIAKGFDDDEK